MVAKWRPEAVTLKLHFTPKHQFVLGWTCLFINGKAFLNYSAMRLDVPITKQNNDIIIGMKAFTVFATSF
jgi:hypothetical protein